MVRLAGSLSTFIYHSDDGTKYLIRLKRINALAAGFALATTADLCLLAIPRNLKPRYIYCCSATGERRKIYIPSIASDLWTGAVKSLNLMCFYKAEMKLKSEAFFVTSCHGETRRVLKIKR